MGKMINNVMKEFGEVETRSSMKLIGISGRTSNEKEMAGEGIIPRMWNRFTTERIVDKIPNLAPSGEIISAYYEIESDDRSPYSFFIGMEVSSFDEVPAGMVSLEVPSGSFLKVSTEWGSFQDIGISAWMNIWASDDLRKLRRFDVDLEIYGKDATKPENGRFDIYIGV